MADLLGIGSSGISVAQQALSTVSNNIANLSTEGYSRQTTEIRQAQPKDVGNGYIGTGAYFDRVSRQYDSFLESSLQQATSDLESQGAAVEYANRLLDVLGDEKIGLTTALNKFFSSAKSLSTDPASPALRGIMLRESDALAARFNGLEAQLSDLGEQSLSALEADVRSVNSLADQIAEVNRQMLKKSSALDQAPELLDTRDQLLRELSEYVQIRTSFDARGSVTVSLSESATKGRLVSGTKSSGLAVSPSASDPSRLDYRLQGELTNEPLTGLPSGSVSGYARFYEETLVEVRSSLNLLAEVLVDEVNAIQTTGLDGEGQIGNQFFQIVPSFEVDRGASSGDYNVQVVVDDPDNYRPSNLTIAYDGIRGLWFSKDEAGVSTFANQQGLLELDDLTIQISGKANVGDQFTLTPDTGAARGIQLAISDGIEIAAASLFRVIPSSTNSGVFDPKAFYEVAESPSGSVLAMGALETGRPAPVLPSVVTPLTVVPAGQNVIEFTIDPAAGSSAALQIMTTDGVHLVGAVGDQSIRETMVSTLPQFAATANYSSDYINGSGPAAYKDFELSYGARAESEQVTELLPLGGLYLEAPYGTDFAGGGIDFTLEPASTFDQVSLVNSLFADTSLGTVSVVDDVLYLGQGGSAAELGTLETLYNGFAQTLRVRFSDQLPADTITDELGSRVSALVTFNNGSDLSSSSNVIKKTITAELFTSDFSENIVQSRDFVSTDLVEAGQVLSGGPRYLAKLTTRGLDYAAGAGRVLIDEGDLLLNGVELGDLVVGSSGVLSADDVKGWLDSAGTDIEVQAHNVIEISGSSLRLAEGVGLQINGVTVTSLSTESTTRFTSDADLLASINAETDSTGVFAQRLENGNLIIRNNDLGGANIVIGGLAGSGSNALGVSSKAYIGNLSFALESSEGDSIRLDLGQDGQPADLNLIGLDTQIRLSGQIDEDLLVFVDGDGGALVTASSEPSGVTVADGLRSRQFEFEFVAADLYRIRDLTTDTVVAERDYQGELSLSYQGIRVSLDNPANIGDSFVVDGNNLGPNGAFDAQGNNSNILRVVDLESKSVLDGGLTLTEGYLSFVGDVGNMATQSEIAHDALQIVQTQAIEARDRVSGVNLDQEAADLIRFQQAYQASAQVMQVATRLFDTMLQIR